MLMLSDHFSLEELVFSQAAARKGLANDLNAFHLAALKRLCVTLLEPLREALGRPLKISSGYRSPAVNRAVGGAPESAHLKGCAADVTAQGLTPEQIGQIALAHKLPFQQLIAEFGSWVHLSVPDKISMPPAREMLIATRLPSGTVAYSRWSAR